MLNAACHFSRHIPKADGKETAVDACACTALVNLVAEDNAIEDTIYHLHRALNSGRIDLEKFIRTARALAEEQFMKRALIEKIQAGLPPGDADLRWTSPAEWR
ncbi:hypothetical protein DAEQUDRAFT_765747 [Daedalea quercina L-15889]|uniref:SB domain-containing protein n=1 Tax=Daedalea quercina L-15889 TaxID=1314783 RepID=A0A165Q3D4_9APHY|nr:hypothetical protein DAEQUDRAFT_765747 [Daedalea quercina L-15889]